MGGGVSLRMPVTVGERDDPVQGGKDVPRDVRVGILIDRDRRGRVGHKETADSVLIPVSRIAAATRSVMSIISHRAVVLMVNNVIPSSFRVTPFLSPLPKMGFEMGSFYIGGQLLIEPPADREAAVDEIGSVFASRRRPETLPDLPDPLETGEKSGQERPAAESRGG